MCEKTSDTHTDSFPYAIDRASIYMHSTPELSGEMCDELPYGTRLHVIGDKCLSDTSGAWYRCETDYGYCGYVQEKYLVPSPVSDNPEPLYPFVVTAPFCDVLLDSLYKYRPILTLPRASVVLARRPSLCGDRFFPIYHKNRRFFVPTASLRPYIPPQKRKNAVSDVSSDFDSDSDSGSYAQLTNRTSLRKQLCDDALSYLGVPYRWGGRTPSGIDCSGLCFTVYAINGLPLWRDAFADRRFVHETDKDSLLPGDLIYFKGHRALYIGDGEYVHASASTGYVTVNSLNRDSIIWRSDLAENLVCYAKSNFL